MNGKDFKNIMELIRRELAEPEGIFQRQFGHKTPEELEALMETAAVALLAADRYYAQRTELEFDIRERDEHA